MNQRSSDSAYEVGKMTVTPVNLLILGYWCILTFLAAFRYVDASGVGGADIPGYVNDFELSTVFERFIWLDLNKIATLRTREPLLYIFFYIVRKFTANFRIMFLLYYGFFSFCIIRFLMYFSKAVNGISSLVLVPTLFISYLYGFSSMRFSLAVGLFLISMIYYDQKKMMGSVLFSALAFFSHYLIILPIMTIFVEHMIDRFGLRRKVKKRTVITFAVIIELVIYVGSSVLYSILNATKYYLYLSQGNSLRGQIPYIISGMMLIVFYDGLKKKFGSRIWLVDGAIICYLLFPLSVQFGVYRLYPLYVGFRVFAIGGLLYVLMD